MEYQHYYNDKMKNMSFEENLKKVLFLRTWKQRVGLFSESLIIQVGSEVISYLSSAKDQRAEGFSLIRKAGLGG